MKYFILLSFCLFIIPIKLLSNIPEGYDEAVFSVRYNSFSSEKIVYFSFDKEDLYIPFTEYLSFLLIYYTTEDGEIFEGYVNSPDSTFTIDFKNKSFTSYNAKKSVIPDTSWFALEGQIYCKTKLLDSIFAVSTKLNVNDLSAYMKSEITMPILRNYKTSKKMGQGDDLFTEEVPDYPKFNTSSFTFLNGGILDYSLTGSNSGIRNYGSYSLSMGLELLGGAFQISNVGNYNNIENKVETYTKYAWKYNFEENKYISTVDLGLQYTTIDLNQPNSFIRGSSAMIYGFKINNRPLQMPRNYEKRLIQKQLGTGWKSEIKVDESKTLYARTADDGRLSFLIPIRYGVTKYEAKCYGPNGEFYQFGDEIYVPTQMLKAWQIQYDITGGLDQLDDSKVINGNFQLGLTSWETFNFSIFQREGLQPELFFGNLTKLVGNMILGLNYSPDNIFGSSLNFNTRSGENISVAYTKFLGKSSFNSNNATDRVDFQGSLSRIFGSNISSNLYGSYYQGKEYKNLSFTPSFSTYLFNFSIMSKYLLYYTINQNGQISRRDGMDFDISYYTGLGELFGFDNRIRFNFRTNYDFANKQFGNLTLVVDDDLGKGLRLSGSVSRNMSTGLISSTLTFSLYNDILNFRSNGNFIATQPANYSSSVNGSLNFDLSEGSYYFTNSMGGGGRGKGNASVTFYQDINNNGKREEDEPIMKGVKISTPGKFTRTVQKDKTILLQDLVPGDRYAVKVVAESFANPYIRPQISEFSFYPEPNTITKIDIPCFSTGILEGRLTKNENGEVVGQGGLKVHILSEDSTFTSAVEVFSDGSFYTMGVPIGKYTMFVDTVQLKLLKSVSEPSTLNFEVKPTIDGDYISQLEFLIIPKSKLQQDLLAGTQESIGAFKATSEFEAQNAEKAGLKFDDKHDSTETNKPIENAQPTEQSIVKPDSSAQQSPVNLMSEDSYEQELRNNIIQQNQIVNSFKGNFNTKLVLYYQKSKDTFLSAKMKKDLDKLAKELLQQKNITLIVEGYSDKGATLEEDYATSTKRANEVVGYLIQKGLKSNQIMIHPKGSIVAPVNNTGGANAKNLRCVIIKVLGE